MHDESVTLQKWGENRSTVAGPDRTARADGGGRETAVVSAALLACDLIEAAYGDVLDRQGRVLAAHDRQGVQAYVLDRYDGARWLIVPGSDERRDWLRNLASQVPWPWAARAAALASVPSAQIPEQGDSGAWWAWGFLAGARLICDWLDAQPVQPTMAAGHSLGAAMLQIVAWSRDVGEAHALAAPRVLFSSAYPGVPGLHCWIAPDDAVTAVPFGARHVGLVHNLPRLDRPGEEHRVRWYRLRLQRIWPSS